MLTERQQHHPAETVGECLSPSSVDVSQRDVGINLELSTKPPLLADDGRRCADVLSQRTNPCEHVLPSQFVAHLPEPHPPEPMQPMQPLQPLTNPSSLEVRQVTRRLFID